MGTALAFVTLFILGMKYAGLKFKDFPDKDFGKGEQKKTSSAGTDKVA